ncbi:MAG: ATP synthase subunit I [Betaproteobacteria bacterium]
MDDPAILVAACAAGLVLGGFFYGGLWWTVRRGIASPQPGLLFLGSLLLRTAIALAGFYFVSGLRWERLVACLLGFVIARAAITWLAGNPARFEQKTGHAP